MVLDDSGAWQPIRKPSAVRAAANLTDYHRVRAEFCWEAAATALSGLPGGGLNIAYGAVGRHAEGPRRAASPVEASTSGSRSPRVEAGSPTTGPATAPPAPACSTPSTIRCTGRRTYDFPDRRPRPRARRPSPGAARFHDGIRTRLLRPRRELRDALELDSIDFPSFVERLTEAAGRGIDEADYPRLTTIASGVDFLTRKA